jgi:uncharacterized protein YaiL (DUF2058 family)
MAESLRDQLLKSGLVKNLKNETKNERGARGAPARPGGAPGQGGSASSSARAPNAAPKSPAKPGAKPGAPQTRGELDLAQAYALRAKSEREQREREQREAEQRAKEKRERREHLVRMLHGRTLNRDDAEHARHFPHGDKIRRVYCTREQLEAVNRGEIAVVQLNGRYLLVTSELAREVRQVNPDALVLLVDPNAPAEDDVPADLVW